MVVEVKVSKAESLPLHSRCQSNIVKAMAKKNPGNSSSNSGNNNDNAKSSGDGDGLKRNNPFENHKPGDTKPHRGKPLDWREFRAFLYTHEQVENSEIPDKEASQRRLPLEWAHPISAPENGSLLVATEKLDGVRTFERTVILLLRSGAANNPQEEGPFGVIINRPLNKKMKHMNPTNNELATTFGDCSLHFGGPLDASMFLVRIGEASGGLPGFEEVIPGLYFGSRNSLDGASTMVRSGRLKPQDFGFFMGYAGWQVDQLGEEIESGYWHVASCSANLISGFSKHSSDGLWREILQLMGGRYSELSRKPKQDI
ncbi:hypothetical protein M569_08135 [Genlisea aurea]|uniref:Transcriptional regulator n=1 Tax=Genlisea aurea TaxID=192259 RepID=S8DTY8_9LAMI|nr:hypothetical protein M569_08135 [Genlisea aurea]